MKLLPTLLCLALLASPAVAATKTPKKAPTKPPVEAPAPAPVPEEPLPVTDPAVPVPTPKLKVEDFFAEVIETAKLSDHEKKAFEELYFADGKTLAALLNSELSPLEKARQASDLRNQRNAKIEMLLVETDRRHAFLLVESKYRVALLELAAEGGLVPPPPAEKK